MLGLGANGHLGFNEPAETLRPGPHVAELSESSLGHAMVQGHAANIRYGLTLGMADILRARCIILLVNGRHKHRPMQRLFATDISTCFPASFLYLHPDVTCFCDREAMSG